MVGIELVPSPAEPAEILKDSRIWGFWPTDGFSLAICFTFAAVQSIVVVAFLTAKLGFVARNGLNQLLESLKTDGLLISLSIFVSAVICTGLIVLFIKLKHTSIREYLGLVPLSWRAVLGLVGLVALLLVVIELLSRLMSNPSDSSYMVDMKVIYRTSGWPLILWLAVAGFAPLFEEVFFRGFLFVGLRHSRLGAAGTVLVTAILWAFLHIQYSIAGILQILALGIVFGVVRLKTRSLWSTLWMHSLWNAATLLAVAFSLSGN
jgi:membrane protease YdiL (CAAX protease family)